MIFRRRNFLAGALLSGIAACGPSKFKSYSGPRITRVVVNKGARRMYLFSGEKALKVYPIGLGTYPVGQKEYEGDGKTPEGLYYIDRRNPDSRYHLSIGISYPNEQDIARAAEQGLQVGSDIFIHGQGPEGRVLSQRGRDWTVGCIAVTDEQAEEIYAMVEDGTPIEITP
ncbi:L,D-transpeptidase family protein [Paracoccus methylarcula]|uniref:L,D-TPase catalytic domain-containing protein n=1 Tax=Paracoccus methylarcula TaxID=72022 RepID=A0A3R7LND5_9RHOB|nr:L,D-transpeptidase family protein [Paracoccus methylarcula]RNF33269.1 hypothetical protein A7A09_017735 [Paracoccus methylarcula]